MEPVVSTLISLILLLPSALFGVVTQQAPSPAQPRPVRNGSLPAVSPDGSRIAFFSNRSGTNDLFVIGRDGSGELQLTNTPENESFAGWSADSKHILFSVLKDNNSTVYSIDVDGKNLRPIAMIAGRNPVVSPNGKQLLYATGSWTEMRLLLSGLDGANPQQVNDGKSIAWNVHWSPDGKRFAFTGRSDPKSEIGVFVANADGSEVRQISHVPLEEGAGQWPVWSADGRQLAIQVSSRTQKNSAHIWIVDVASEEGRKLAAHDQGYLDETPSWFPDGKRIAFQSDRTGRMEVWIMNVDGTNPRQVTR